MLFSVGINKCLCALCYGNEKIEGNLSLGCLLLIILLNAL